MGRECGVGGRSREFFAVRSRRWRGRPGQLAALGRGSRPGAAALRRRESSRLRAKAGGADFASVAGPTPPTSLEVAMEFKGGRPSTSVTGSERPTRRTSRLPRAPSGALGRGIGRGARWGGQRPARSRFVVQTVGCKRRDRQANPARISLLVGGGMAGRPVTTALFSPGARRTGLPAQ
jgi:hypothetical protein